MKTRNNLSTPSPEEMRKLIEALSPAERAMLKDPAFITEDEADIIVCMRRMDEPTYSAEAVLAELALERRRRSA